MGGVEHSVKATVIHNTGSAASHPVPDTRTALPASHHHQDMLITGPERRARRGRLGTPPRGPQPRRRASLQRDGDWQPTRPLTRLPHTLSSSVPEHSRDPLLYQKFENKLTMAKIYIFSAFLPTKHALICLTIEY